MDTNRWKTTLYEWIKATKLIDLSGNLESVDIEAFYKEYKGRLKDPGDAPVNLTNFLNVNFPDFEMHFDDTNKVSPLDHMYIFSMILFHSCVKQTLVYFQKSCETLCNRHQVTIASFLGLMSKCTSNKEKLNKTTLRRVINEAAPPNSPGLGLPFLNMYSPIKTPKMEKSPPTPSKIYHDEKMRELKFVKTQLDNERYERGYLEVQLKQTEDKLSNFSKERKKYLHEIQELRNDLLSKETENYSPNKNNRSQEIQQKLRNEIKEKIDLVSNLKLDVEQLKETIQSNQTRMAYTEKEMLALKARAIEAEICKDELKEELDKREEAIKCLSESNQELQTFISETRGSFSKEFNGSSSELLDYSFSQISHSTVGMNSTGSGENLGRCVIDLQLKEKENENSKLKELLAEMTTSKESLDVSNEELRQKISSLEMELAALKKSYELTKNESENLKLNISELINTNTKLEHHVNEKVQKVEALQKDLEEAKEAISNINQQLSTVNQIKMDLEAKVQDDLVVIETLKQEHNESQDKVNQQIALLTAQHEEDEKALNGSIEQILELENNIKSKNEEVEHLTITKSSLESCIEELTKQNTIDRDQLLFDFAKQQEQFVELTEKHQVEIKSLEEQKSDLNRLTQEQSATLKDLTEQITANEAEIKKYDSQVDRLEDVIQKIENEKSSLIITIQSKEEELESLSKENEDNLKQVSAVNEKADLLSVNLESTQAKLETVSYELQLKEDSFTKLQANFVNLESEIKLTNKAKDDLAQQFDQNKTDLEFELIARQEKLDEALAEITEAQLAIEESQSKVKDLEMMQKKLQCELADEIKVRILVSTEVKDQDVQLVDLRNQISEQRQEAMTLQTNLDAAVEQKLQVEEKLNSITVELQEKIQLETHNDKLMEQNHEKIKELLRLLEENDERTEKLLASVDSTKQKLEASRKSQQELSDNVISLEKLLADLRNDKASVEADSKSLKISFEEKCMEVENLLATIKYNEIQLINKIEEVKKLENESAACVKTNTYIIQEKESKIVELEQKIYDLATSVQDNLEINNQIRQQLEDIKEESSKTAAENNENILKKVLEAQSLSTQIDELKSLMEKKDDQIIDERKSSTIEIQAKDVLILALRQQIADEQASTNGSIEQLQNQLHKSTDLLNKTVELNNNSNQEKENLIQKLTQECLELTSLTEQYTEELKKMEAESIKNIEDHNKVIQDQKTLNQQHVQEIQNLTSLVEEKDETSKILQDQITNIQEESSKFTKINASMIQQNQTEIEELEKKLLQNNQDLINKSIEHEKVVEELKVEMKNVTEIKNNIQNQCDAVLQDKNSLAQSNRALSEKITGMKTRLVDQETKISDLEMQTTSLKENMQHHIELKLTLENLETKYSMIKERAEDLELSVEQLLKEKKTLERENEDLMENRVIGATKLEEKCNFLCSELEQKQKDFDEMAIKAESTLKVVKILENDNAALDHALKNLAEAKKLSDEKIVELTNNQSTVYQEITEKEAKSSELLANKDNLMLELTQQLNDLKSQINQQSAEISAQEIAKTELKSQNQDLLSKLEHNISSQDVLQQKLLEQSKNIVLMEEKLHEATIQSNKLTDDKKEIQIHLDRLDVENHHYKDQLTLLQRDLSCTKESLQQENVKSNELSKHLEELTRKDRELTDLKLKLEEEKKFNDANSNDTKILYSKLLMERQKAEEAKIEWQKEIKTLQSKVDEEKRLSEEKIKDNRLEMDGKLEKMKDKMKSLYNDEMAKKKEKYEREKQEFQAQNIKLTKKMQLLEQHTEKLSKQIYQLNDSQLEYQKENEYMKSKLRFIEKSGHLGGSTTSIGSAFKLATTTHNSQHKGQFAMEDEEGELFNNTYLADLKTGGDPYSFLELQQRNSMMLPHLRSSYAVTDVDNKNYNEEDIKDGGLQMDDSSASLLQNGLRCKKQSTSYKRPGPPTPSKNAGRLSIGPNDVQYKEVVLKDSTNENNLKKSTPGRLKQIFGGGKSKDENTTPRRRLSFFQNKKQTKY